MRILFDNNAPAPLRHSLRSHAIETAAERGWHRLTNGELLDAAEAEGFDILLTADKGFQHQVNLRDRHIAIVILSRGNWPDVKNNIRRIVVALREAKGGTCNFVDCKVAPEASMKENAS
jgi:predicted nuclease of predicted toxin-antitoxin system